MERLYQVKRKYVTKKSYKCHDNAKNAISLDPSQPLNRPKFRTKHGREQGQG